MLLLAFAISCISAVAIVPPEVPLLLTAEGPQMPPPEQWKIDKDTFIVTIPDLSKFKHPALLINGVELYNIKYSPDLQHFVSIQGLIDSRCSVDNISSLHLLNKVKGYLKITPSKSSYLTMIFDLSEADLEKMGVQSEETLNYEVLTGSINEENNLILAWDEDRNQYIGKVRYDLTGKNGNILTFRCRTTDGFFDRYNKDDFALNIIDTEEHAYKPFLCDGNSRDFNCYLPKDSKAIEITILGEKYKINDDYVDEYDLGYELWLNLSNYSTPSTQVEEYIAQTFYSGSNNDLYREHFYDFNGDGSFSIMPDRAYDAPVLTTIFPDGKVYGIDNKGHRIIRYNNTAYDVLFDDEYKGGKSLVPFDYNNDGKYDFKYGDNVYTIDNTGNLNLDALTLLTPGQYEGIRSELKLSTGGEGIPGMGDMFGRDGGGVATGGVGTFADFNADGLTDVMVYMNNSDSYHTDVANTLFLNTGKDRTLIYTSAPKTELIRDFDGDGLVDMVIKETDGLKIYLQRRGQASQVVNAYRGFSGTVLGARDVDNDGDIDLIVSASNRVSWGANSTSDYYVAVIENLGNGKFAKRENFLINASDSNFEFHDIRDIDADGKYEIIFKHYQDGYRTCYVKIESASKLGEIIEISNNSVHGSSLLRNAAMTIIPINNDGRMAYPSLDYQYLLFWSTNPSWGVNSKPARPVAPTINYDRASRRLSVSWPVGSDNETPAADLTYELRIGTSEGTGDIVAANALADGTRRNIAEGANGYVREKVYDVSNWPSGKIYVSYQVVDGCWRGSEFSPAAVFENDLPSVAIAMTADIPGAGKSFEAWLENGPVAATTYAWTCTDDGTIEVVDADRQRVALTFTTPGIKVITLTATDAQGHTASATRKIDVNPQSINVFSNYNYKEAFNTLDLDGDGILELNASDGFYVQTADGTFEKYRRMFNTQRYSGITFDYNRDGLPDIIGKKDVLLNIGEGDMEALNDACGNLEWKYDLNNDGLADTANEINKGDYKDTNAISITARGLAYDYDGDGLLDNIYSNWDSQNGLHHIMYARNIDGYTFADAVELISSKYALQGVADIDGDGTMDILCSDYGYGFGVTSYSEYIYIHWGNGSASTLVQCPDGRPFGEISSIADLDNNGVLDLIVKLQTTDSPAYPDCVAVYMYTDHSYMNHSERAEITGMPFINPNGNYRAHYGEFILSKPNTLPEPPTGLRAAQSAKDVVIEWNEGSDAETPAKALRYNISIKHKGAEGENAYLISPMNGGDDQTPLPSPIRLLTSTKFTIPIASIPAGDYEIKLQTVDTHMGASKFSETLQFTVAEGAYLDLPTTVMLGQLINVNVHTNYSGDIDFGKDADVEVKENKGSYNEYSIIWRSEGLKEVKANGKAIASTMVVAAPDASFMLPEKVLVGATVNIPGAAEGKWEVSTNDATWKPIGNISQISARVDGNNYNVTFAKAGQYTLRRTITRSQGSGAAQNTVTVVDEGQPEISLVACEGDSHYTLRWEAASIPSEVIAVKIYRETESYGIFAFVEEVSPSDGKYTDPSSNAAVSPSRYRISWRMSYGESEPSEAHQPIHVQINKGLGEAINLMWSQYQGTQVQSYRILRGTSPDNLEPLATVSGSISSYTDLQPGGVKYYAVETVVATPAAIIGTRNVRTGLGGARSNIVCTSEARNMTLAQSISIISPTGTNTLYMASEHNTLTAAIMPAAASSRANWEIVTGNDKASIDAYGRLTYYGPGTITVKATACDGSGVSITQDFEIKYSDVLATRIEFADGHMQYFKVGDVFRLEYAVLPAGAYQNLEWFIQDGDENNPVLSVTPDGLITALRVGDELVTAKCVDDSGVFDSVHVYVEANSGVENVVSDNSHINVYTTNGEIVVNGAKAGSFIRIYTLDGSVIAFANADGSETHFQLEPGFYIVDANGQSLKVKL